MADAKDGGADSGARGANGVRLGRRGASKAEQAGRPVEVVLVGGANRVIHKRAPQTGGWNQSRRRIFLATLASSCNVTASAAAAGMSMSSAYWQRTRDPVFAAAWNDALERGYDRLHEALLRMALRGVEPAEEVGEGAGLGDTGAGAIGAGEQTGTPGCGAPVLTTADSVRLALTLMEKHRAMVTGAARKPGTIVRARPEDTDAALRKLLDGLARRQTRDADRAGGRAGDHAGACEGSGGEDPAAGATGTDAIRLPGPASGDVRGIAG